jgi:hypothetical protein
MGSTCSSGTNSNTSIVFDVGSGRFAKSASSSTTVSPEGSSYPLAISEYGTCSPSAAATRWYLTREPSERRTWWNAMLRSSVAE